MRMIESADASSWGSAQTRPARELLGLYLCRLPGARQQPEPAALQLPDGLLVCCSVGRDSAAFLMLSCCGPMDKPDVAALVQC